MAMCNRFHIFKSFRMASLDFSTSCFVNSKWRRRQGLESHPLQFGPLTNLPDYSFVDGRPIPLSLTKLKKFQNQEKLCKKVVDLVNEIDVGLEMYHRRQKEKQTRRELIIKNKLKEKGAALLKKNKTEIKT